VRAAGCAVAMLAALWAAGCMASRPLGPGEMDRYWSMTHDTEPSLAHLAASLGGRALPSRWVIRQQPSLIRSTVSLVRAGERLRAGTEEIEFSVSPAYARMAADLLARARAAIVDLAETAESGSSGDSRRWAETLVRALAQVESISRAVAPDDETQAGEPLGLAAEPLLELISVYLNERTGGALVPEMKPQEAERVREILAQMVLRVGFSMAGRELEPGVRESVAEAMRRAGGPGADAPALADVLQQHLAKAPPAAAEGHIGPTVRAMLTWAPKMLQAMESLLGQWDRMDRVELDLLKRDGEVLVAVGLYVRPGQEVRLPKLIMLQPDVVFRGGCRMSVLPHHPTTRETVVAFDPVEGGAVELRFEGIAYGLVRLLAFPLASGALREIRVLAASRAEGDQVNHVAVLMEAAGEKGDPRRLLVFQDVRIKDLLRRPFSVESIVRGEAQAFSYLTPVRQFYYRRAKGDAQAAGAAGG